VSVHCEGECGGEDVKDSRSEEVYVSSTRSRFSGGDVLTLYDSASSLGMMSDEEKKMQRIEDIRELLS
jgi:hypothetical protein